MRRRPNRILVTARAGRGGQVQSARLKRRAFRFLAALRLERSELSLSLVGDAEIRALNSTWRGKDKPTDVLSFPAGDGPAPGPRQLGDVVISLDTAKRAAVELGATVNQELDRYLAHGLLHLLGHDHLRPAEARRMRALEDRLLGHGGMLSREEP